MRTLLIKLKPYLFIPIWTMNSRPYKGTSFLPTSGSTLIAKANNDGVRVRVVTDSEQLSVSGSQIGRLRREGILVRHDSSSYLMHHKFAIIDEG